MCGIVAQLEERLLHTQVLQRYLIDLPCFWVAQSSIDKPYSAEHRPELGQTLLRDCARSLAEPGARRGERAIAFDLRRIVIELDE